MLVSATYFNFIKIDNVCHNVNITIPFYKKFTAFLNFNTERYAFRKKIKVALISRI